MEQCISFPLFPDTLDVSCALTDKIYGVEVKRSGRPMLCTTMTNLSAMEVIEICFIAQLKWGGTPSC
jgi:hypothetical protein